MFSYASVCVRICVYLRSTYINKEIQTERCCQACKSNTVIFINVRVSTSESHSPWGSRCEKWLIVKEVLFLFIWIKRKCHALSSVCTAASPALPVHLFNWNCTRFCLFLWLRMLQQACIAFQAHYLYPAWAWVGASHIACYAALLN